MKTNQKHKKERNTETRNKTQIKKEKWEQREKNKYFKKKELKPDERKKER